VFGQVLPREVKIWHGLDHQNVVKFIGWTSRVCEDTLTVCLVSAWCDGGNVKEYLRNHEGANRRRLVCDVGRGLVYLHFKHIIHGDIKPENIVVSYAAGGGVVALLCDFGLSSILSDITTHPHISSITGTLRYAPPELFSVTSMQRNEASDIWAFGCTATEVGPPLVDPKQFHLPKHRSSPTNSLITG
ncbi:kinase-like domain-containing protein, partial [Cantharellus anzutake]|uniref:kinase-like domain-containing protein n=1 Tax=Cantharellus anzutake TaxID=1750568 RepID=UPI001903919E